MSGAGEAQPALSLTPIGVVRSPFVEKVQAPRQPDLDEPALGQVELFAGRDFEHALEDLTTFRYVWLIFWFHQSEGWRPKVLPPRSDKRRGVFATRSPHRPNPLGMSLVELTAIEGLVLHVKGLDLLDGTPILDIKPYIPYADSRAGAGHGWLDAEVPAAAGAEPGGAGAAADPIARFTVSFTADARAELELLLAFGIDLESQVRRALELGPEPHPYRRIKKLLNGSLLALKDFRVSFESAGKVITVTGVATGYRPKQLAALDDRALDPHRALAALRRA